MVKLLLVGLGGFIGAVGRYAVSGWVHALFRKSEFPIGTLTVNIVGCLLIGLLGGLVVHKNMFSQDFRLCVMIGLLGSFTTYSTFSYETLALLQEARPGAALLNIVLHLGVGLLAVYAGYTLSNV